jgi:hypothetical protein
LALLSFEPGASVAAIGLGHDLEQIKRATTTGAIFVSGPILVLAEGANTHNLGSAAAAKALALAVEKGAVGAEGPVQIDTGAAEAALEKGISDGIWSDR